MCSTLYKNEPTIAEYSRESLLARTTTAHFLLFDHDVKLAHLNLMRLLVARLMPEWR